MTLSSIKERFQKLPGGKNLSFRECWIESVFPSKEFLKQWEKGWAKCFPRKLHAHEVRWEVKGARFADLGRPGYSSGMSTALWESGSSRKVTVRSLPRAPGSGTVLITHKPPHIPHKTVKFLILSVHVHAYMGTCKRFPLWCFSICPTLPSLLSYRIFINHFMGFTIFSSCHTAFV